MDAMPAAAPANTGAQNGAGALSEWRAHWPVPFAAMIGYTALGLQVYSIGPFVPHIEQAFGWSRSEVMAGVSLSSLVSILLSYLLGVIVDRFGPRAVGLLGFSIVIGAFALLGTATGTFLNWIVLWLLMATGVAMVQPSIWSSGIAPRFDKARGMALAIVLCGAPLTAAIAPVLATTLIEHEGWRGGFFGVAAVWFVVGFPILFRFFRNPTARDQADGPEIVPAALPGLTLREGLRTRAFWQLMIAFGAFSFYNMAVGANLVPLLSETGVTAMQAAEIAAFMGLVGIGARLGTGVLLDRLPARVIGGIVQMLPVAGCLLLYFGHGSIPMLMTAALCFGIATGAEVDVALYLATRQFGLKAFAALFGLIQTFGSFNAMISPYIAGWLYDVTGNYHVFLVVIAAVMATGAVSIGTTPRPPRAFAHLGHEGGH